ELASRAMKWLVISGDLGDSRGAEKGVKQTQFKNDHTRTWARSQPMRGQNLRLRSLSEARQSWFNNESVDKDSPQPSTHLTPVVLLNSLMLSHCLEPRFALHNNRVNSVHHVAVYFM